MKLKSFIVAALCAIVQYYDYHLFGFLASKISKNFFDSSDPVVQLLRTYMVMSIAVLAKPIGALILGRIGDIYGRFATIIISLFGTAIASLVIALTPSHEKIGIFSAVILLGARMCVAGLVSSGTDGIRIYIFERIGQGKQCLGNGIITFSTQIGSFLAALSAWFFTLDVMPDYSWRIAFMIGTIMGVAVIIIKMNFIFENDDENISDPNYELYKDQKTISIALKNWKSFIPCSLLAGCIGSTYQFLIIFFGTYNFEVLKLVEHSKMKFYTSIGVVLYMVFSIVGGFCSDYFGRLKVANIGSLILLIVSITFCFMLSLNKFSVSLYFLMSIMLPFVTMPALAFFKQSIPKVIRYRIFSFAHAIGSILISAPTAYLSTLLYYETNISWIAMSYFIATVIVMFGSINALASNRVN
jgi:MHS family proline/betaine transporter-like MFS transporter